MPLGPRPPRKELPDNIHFLRKEKWPVISHLEQKDGHTVLLVTAITRIAESSATILARLPENSPHRKRLLENQAIAVQADVAKITDEIMDHGPDKLRAMEWNKIFHGLLEKIWPGLPIELKREITRQRMAQRRSDLATRTKE